MTVQPAGELAAALQPLEINGYEVVTAAAGSLGAYLTTELAALIRAAKVEAVRRAHTAPSVVVVDDELAHQVRSRIGHLSGPVWIDADGRSVPVECATASGPVDPAPLSDRQVAELEDQEQRHADDEVCVGDEPSEVPD